MSLPRLAVRVAALVFSVVALALTVKTAVFGAVNASTAVLCVASALSILWLLATLVLGRGGGQGPLPGAAGMLAEGAIWILYVCGAIVAYIIGAQNILAGEGRYTATYADGSTYTFAPSPVQKTYGVYALVSAIFATLAFFMHFALFVMTLRDRAATIAAVHQAKLHGHHGADTELAPVPVRQQETV